MKPTEQFWAGEFGADYVARQEDDIGPRVAMFRQALRGRHINSAIEFGAGIGTNLKALRLLNPSIQLAAVEINRAAIAQLPGNVDVYEGSILGTTTDARRWELAITRGLLIHTEPMHLQTAYSRIYHASSKFILLAEYYNPIPVEVEYRGHAGKLFKRDFAGEMLDIYRDLTLIDYGFIYHRDQISPQDDVTWFLLEKG